MPSPAERRRNNVRTGVFVTVALVFALAILIALTDAWRTLITSTHGYTVTYRVESGVNNLKPGAEVRVGGVAMGSVEDIRPRSEEQPFETIEVDFTLDDRIRMYDNATILVTSPIIGSEAWLDVVDVGGPHDAPGDAAADVALVEPGGEITGTSSLGFLTTLLGPESASTASDIVDQTGAFSRFLQSIPEEYRQRIVPILDKTDETMASARNTVRAVEEDYGQWRGRVDEILATVNSAADNLDATLAETNDIVASNRSGIDAFIADMESFGADAATVSQRIRNETLDQVTRLLERGEEGVDGFASVAEELEVQLDTELPNIKEALANARLASQQLKLTTVEVRRSPWKLLYRPGTDELEHELLYEAARSFAVAASDLKAASQSVERVMDQHGERLSADDERLDLLRSSLLSSFERYEKAQQQLVNVLLSGGS